MPLLEKIKNHHAVIGVVGLGYVGLPLAVLQTQTGFRVIGFDEDPEKVDQVKKGKSYIGRCARQRPRPSIRIETLVRHDELWVTSQV